jgi:hypothetical protein
MIHSYSAPFLASLSALSVAFDICVGSNFTHGDVVV